MSKVTSRRPAGWKLAAAAVLSLVATVTVIEVAARWLSLDLSRGLFSRAPIGYLVPNVPTGEAFFRRDGPAVWQGRPRATMLGLLGGDPAYYADEPEVTIRYDAQGFRNEGGLDAWDVAVVGDSFTELGYLSYDDLYTTRAAALLGVRIRNLGVAYTGTLTHTHYLRAYGCHPAARHAVLAFFEGNDLSDTVRERDAVRSVRAGGPRPVVTTIVTPLTMALGLLRSFRGGYAGLEPDAFFRTRTGERPVTVNYAPQDEADLPEDTRRAAREALGGFARTARECGMTPWLLFMPAKLRVVHGHVRFLDSAPAALRAWTSSDLPHFVERLCRDLGIGFLDPTEPLRALADEGVLPYSGVYDTHLDREGSHVVGDVLARGLAGAMRGER